MRYIQPDHNSKQLDLMLWRLIGTNQPEQVAYWHARLQRIRQKEGATEKAANKS